MKNIILLLFLLLSVHSFAQQETNLTLKESESLFLKNNLELLAARFNVDAAQAAIIQARTWENPNISVGLNAYNPEGGKYFDIGSAGEKTAGFDQLIHLGGKKHNEVAIANTNAEVAELEFADLLRNLKLQLRQTYYSLYYQNLSYKSILKQLSNLDSLIISYQTQVQKGNIPMKDLVRLQSLNLSLVNQKSQLYENIVDFQSKLALITGLTTTIIPSPSDDELIVYQTNRIFQPDSLNRLALTNRTDLKIAQKQVDVSNLNIKLQKALAIPDLTVGAAWDQRGGVFKNQVGLNIGIPLPLWNQNRGNIKIARAQLDQVSVQQTLQNNKVTSEVLQSLRKWKEATENYRLLTKSSLQNLEDVQNGIFTNFKNGNLSLIEFTDFMESYHSTLMQYYQFAQNLANACEQINFATNSKIF
jgi:cobalt-zinc-cadmium efflux system outer membrane protein